MTLDPQPIPPPKNKYTKGFTAMMALVLWISVSLVLIFLTKEGNERLESVFMVLAVLDVMLAVGVLVQFFMGKHLAEKE